MRSDFYVMNERCKDIIIYLIAIIFSLTFVLIVIKFLLSKNYSLLLWVCYLAFPVIIIGLIKKNPYLILSQVVILAIPDLFWVFDFIYLILTGHSPMGLVVYFPNQIFLEKIVSMQHFYTVPLSLVALSILKLKKNYKVLLVSLVEIVLVFLLTLLLVPADGNIINCIHLNCINIKLTFLPPSAIWFMFTFSFVISSYFIITSLPFIRKKK